MVGVKNRKLSVALPTVLCQAQLRLDRCPAKPLGRATQSLIQGSITKYASEYHE